MNNGAIGIFDSGLGGLTALKELHNILPAENIIYFGDTSRVPYGTKSQETIIRYAKQDIAFLLSLNVKVIVAACGTVSSVAFSIKDSLPLPFIGVLGPTAVAAANSTKNGRIGIIGTQATIKSRAYSKELALLKQNLEIFEKACPLFVPMVESGIVLPNDPLLIEVTRRYLLELKQQNIDTLILGCTHYPIIKEAISSAVGDEVNIIDSGKETAVFTANFLKSQNLLKSETNQGKCLFYVSDSTDDFLQEAKKFLNLEQEYQVEKIDIEYY